MKSDTGGTRASPRASVWVISQNVRIRVTSCGSTRTRAGCCCAMKQGRMLRPLPATVACSCTTTWELRIAGRKLLEDQRYVVQLRGEDEILGVADKTMLDEIGPACDGRGLLQVAAGRIEAQLIVGELACEQAAFRRPRQSDRDVRLTLGQAEHAWHGDQFDFQAGCRATSRPRQAARK